MRKSGKRAGIASSGNKDFITTLLRNISVDGLPISETFPTEAIIADAAKPDTTLPLASARLLGYTAGSGGKPPFIVYFGDDLQDIKSVPYDGTVQGIMVGERAMSLSANYNNQHILYINSLKEIFA